MGVLKPLKVVIENYPKDKVEKFDAVNNPEDPKAGTRKIAFSKTLYIEQDDFMEDPPKKFYRLAPDREVRFRYSYLVRCQKAIKKDDKIVELRCTIDPETKGGYAPDGRKVKSTIHWVSADNAIDAEVRLYDRLFTIEDPAGQKEKDFKEFLNPNSLVVLRDCKVEPCIKNLKPLDRFQFERLGYFCIDNDSQKNKPVINRTVTLRDTWAKIQEKQS
jgi:glutaminyl-tRNA synthetase